MLVTRVRSNVLGSNTYIVNKNNNLIIVDAGADLKQLEQYVEDNQSVVGIFITHPHFDHIASLDELINKYNCNAYLSNDGIDFLYDTKLNESINFDPITIKNRNNIVGLQNGEIVELLDFKIETIYTPGHSSSSVCYIIDNVMFTGDTLFKTTIGRIDLLTSNKSDMLNSLIKLNNINNIVTYYSGHNTCFDKEQAKSVIKKYINYLKEYND